jgi:hypothetical protein
MNIASPSILALDGSGSGQGEVFLSGTSLLATSRSYRNLGQPAQPGDPITIQVTGLDPSITPLIEIGRIFVNADSVEPAQGQAGVSNIAVTVPAGLASGSTVPVTVMTAGTVSGPHSNTVTMAIEDGSGSACLASGGTLYRRAFCGRPIELLPQTGVR